jgi:hypothetical protein
MRDESGHVWKAKHKNPPLRGALNGNSRLTEAQVNEIRRRYTGKRGEQSALAREFHVRQGNIWYIVNHVTWAG